ncbi:MAG TPA: hypothetical protein VNU66_13330 [Mycobacteriales bacterium]|nr:hypothetical protein [Mycobacteriales bacterium]
MTRWAAYAAYLVGSAVFLLVALRRGAPLIAVGSALFVLGTLLYLVPDARQARRERTRR